MTTTLANDTALSAITEVFQSSIEPLSYDQYLVPIVADPIVADPLPADHVTPYHFTVGRDGGGRFVRFTADGDGFCQGLDTAWRTEDGRWFGRWRQPTAPHGTFATTVGPLTPLDVQRIEAEIRLLCSRETEGASSRHPGV
ncbi:hypothetical protein [Azospirillum rugosum]|uniref:Uncharacterized protein n=1 Tax=Azospirillum rugosum TaxID=416170 RepID=A0ABS4ST41_9PROT|nr:hypothetical protein [Azospirillum rugosum]MBP2295731.1 hypothetical protein [Azospirillum rugosum]MDQ0529158.1 hypothetical protein [Azospirillum rugosum]